MEELDLAKQRLDTGVGYMYVYQPSHPLSNASGKVYVHRYVGSLNVGYWLTSEEAAHHIDENRLNNESENIKVMSHSEHAEHHLRGDDYFEGSCALCGNYVGCGRQRVSRSTSGNLFCSRKCATKFSVKLTLSKEELAILVWEKPTTQLVEQLGLSDVAIGKWCKKLGILKPPRGYWARLKANKGCVSHGPSKPASTE